MPRTRGRSFAQKKTRPSPARLRLKHRQRKRFKPTVATIVTVIEPAHLAVHGIHRAERTGEKIARRIERFGPKEPGFPGAGVLEYLVGSRVELEDLDIPEDVMAELEAEIHDIMENTGSDIVSEASDIVPVDTGNLRDSLYSNVDFAPLGLIVGDTAPYASFVENGTIKSPPRPFLSLAIATNDIDMEAEIDGAINTVLDEQAQNEDAGVLLPGETEADIEMELEITAEAL